MPINLDLRAIAYGTGTFLAGSIATLLIGQILSAQAFIVLCSLVPVASSYIGAYHASKQHITCGVLSVIAGLVLILLPLLLIPGPNIPIAAIVVAYAVLSLIGAFFGNFMRQKNGT